MPAQPQRMPRARTQGAQQACQAVREEQAQEEPRRHPTQLHQLPNMNAEQNLKQQKAEAKYQKKMKAIFHGKLTKKNHPVLYGWNFSRPAHECRQNF